jgi:hypothetical protein
MRVVTKHRLLLIGATFIAGSIALAFSAGAQAQDHYDRDHYDRYYHDHDRVVERPVYVAPRPPVFVAPVVVAPPVYVAPAGPPSLNLNMNIPLR